MGSVCHGSELPFVFNVFTDGESVAYDPTADERALAQDLGSAWANFVTSGDPNEGLSVPAVFPPYDAVGDALLVLEEPGMEKQSTVRDVYCNMWDALG